MIAVHSHCAVRPGEGLDADNHARRGKAGVRTWHTLPMLYPLGPLTLPMLHLLYTLYFMNGAPPSLVEQFDFRLVRLFSIFLHLHN